MDHIQKTPKPPSSAARGPIPPALDDLVLRCLAKSREDRPASALELWEELGAIERSLPRAWDEARAAAWWDEHFDAEDNAALQTGSWSVTTAPARTP
jgi:serine/threonine protein kinase